MSDVARIFPVMQSGYRYYDADSTVSKVRASGGVFAVVGIPWDLIAKHETQAQRNHSQTLARLAERGGLSAGEAVAVMTGKSWSEIPRDEAACHRQLVGMILDYLQGRTAS